MTEAQALLRIQEIDIKLLRDAATLAEMPQQRKLKTIATAKRRVASELTKIVGQRKDVETEIGDLERNLADYREKTEQVKAQAQERQQNYRHIQDLEAQLTSLAKKIEKCEFELVPLNEKLDKLRLAEKNAHLTQDRLEQERAAQTKAFEDDSAAIRREVVALKDERDEVAESVSPELMATYEKKRVRFKGLAVEELHGNLPSICRVKLQPALFHDLVRGDEVTECPYCHRMLITTDALGDGDAR
jgi:predicted  nucleic acid-binding Zn-ribbon protein